MTPLGERTPAQLGSGSLGSKGYQVYHLEPKAVKAMRECLFDEESKSDAIDATGSAYLLYLRDAHGLSFRISAITPESGSKASVLRSLVIQSSNMTG